MLNLRRSESRRFESRCNSRREAGFAGDTSPRIKYVMLVVECGEEKLVGVFYFFYYCLLLVEVKRISLIRSAERVFSRLNHLQSSPPTFANVIL